MVRMYFNFRIANKTEFYSYTFTLCSVKFCNFWPMVLLFIFVLILFNFSLNYLFYLMCRFVSFIFCVIPSPVSFSAYFLIG